MSLFSTFLLNPQLIKVATELGYKAPTPVQEQAIPAALAGKDIVGLAQTGTGKTAAFVLPIIHRLIEDKASVKNGLPRVLVIVPTRELASQVLQTFYQFTKGTRLYAIALYGGTRMNPQISDLRRGVDIIVACPGRLLDHISQRTVNLSKIQTLVLDEADQMFDLGFLPTIKKIISYLPADRQNLLFSATMPSELSRLTASIVKKDAITIRLGESKPTTTVDHALFPVGHHQKTNLLVKLLENKNLSSAIVFTRTRHQTDKLSKKLVDAGFAATALQGDLTQGKRDAAIRGFRSGRYNILVATDIASRGLDIASVSHVINYDIPSTPEVYTHRIGRTGRAEKQGEAFTLITHEDRKVLRIIERSLGKPIARRKCEGFEYDGGEQGLFAQSGRRY